MNNKITIQLAADGEVEIVKQSQTVSTELAEARAATITCDADSQFFGSYLQELIKQKKAFDNLWALYSAPLYEALDNLDKRLGYSVGLKNFKLLEAVLREKIKGYAIECEKRRQLALQAAAKAVAADNTKALTVALNAEKAAVAVQQKGVSVKPKWVAVVVAPDLVPHEYLTPDLKKIQAHAAKFTCDQKPTEIAGVKYELDAGMRVTTK
jgi:hypothetical protein